MLTKKYFDDWLSDLESKYQVLSMPKVSMLDLFINPALNDGSHVAQGFVMSEITKVRALRDELDSKGLLISD